LTVYGAIVYYPGEIERTSAIMAKRKFSVNESFEVVGAFWNLESPDQKFTGTLASKDGKLTLTSAPTYTTIDFANPAERAALFLSGSGLLKRAGNFCGFTPEGDCTLVEAIKLREGGITDMSTGRKVETQEYRVSAAVMGLHLESSEAKAIDSAAFYFTKIHQWLPIPWSMTMGKDGNTFVAPSKANEVFRFRNAPLGAEVFCQVFAGGGAKFRKSAKVKSVARIRVVPEHPQSLEWFDSIAFRLENFLTLCIGTSVSLKKLQFFCGEEDGWLVHKVRRREEKVNFQAWLQTSPSAIASALDKWLAVPDDNRPVETTVLGILRKSTVFVETEFLSLAQALEGFNRIQGGGSKTFAERIREILDLLSADFSLKLIGQRDEFVRKVVETRNYFTHLGIPPKGSVVQGTGDIFDINQRLHALLRCVMLIQLGIPEAELQAPILYQATKWKSY